jgi:hypothetical protein
MSEREFEPNNASTPVVRGLIVFFGAQIGWRARQSIWGESLGCTWVGLRDPVVIVKRPTFREGRER